MVNLLTPDADTVAPRSILFIGGTGVISTAAAERAVALGHRLTILNRGRSTRPVPEGAEILTADVRDASAVRAALAGREFDAVADFITFTPEQVQAGLRLVRREGNKVRHGVELAPGEHGADRGGIPHIGREDFRPIRDRPCGPAPVEYGEPVSQRDGSFCRRRADDSGAADEKDVSRRHRVGVRGEWVHHA